MAKGTNRLVSLDIFRGLTVLFMIIVNTPGSWDYVYAPLRHAKWHGCTPTDLVFPFFLFIVGVSMWYSMKKYGHEIKCRFSLQNLPEDSYNICSWLAACNLPHISAAIIRLSGL